MICNGRGRRCSQEAETRKQKAASPVGAVNYYEKQ